MAIDYPKAKEMTSSSHGKILGEIIRTHGEYIEQREGKEGLKRVEDKLKEFGVPIEFRKTKSSEWVNEGVNRLIMLLAKDLFGWTDDDIFNMGLYAPKVSFMTKLAMRYFVSMDTILGEAPKHWREHVSFGELEVAELDKEKGEAILRIKDYNTDPIECVYHAGYFKGVMELTVKAEMSIEETKCAHKGDDYHEYVVKWKT